MHWDSPIATTDDRDSGTLIAATRRSEIVTATVYLASALSLFVYFYFAFLPFPASWIHSPYEIASLLGSVLSVVSAIRIFMGRKFGDRMALVGALLVWPYFMIVEFSGTTFSSWLMFNLPDDHNSHQATFMATLTILSIGLLFAETASSALRLTPRTWIIRKLPLRGRVWPGFLISFVFIAVWYLNSVRPYRIPIYDYHSARPILSVLHVEKQGLLFHETTVEFYRGGKFYLSHNDRRLFQYSFQTSLASGVLPQASFPALNELTSSPPEIPGSQFSSYVPPRSWNADRWYIFVKGSYGRKAIRVETPDVPAELLNLYYETQKAPQERSSKVTERDVCFGFCYDPTY